jgi:hypothetical protein
MEPGLHCAEGHADDVGDLPERQPGVVMQHEDRAVLGRQTPERAIQRVPVVDRDDGVGSTRSVDRQDPDARGPSTMAAQLLVACIDQEPIQPRRETLGVAKPRELAPGEEECLLDRVLGPIAIAKDPIRDAVAQVAVQVDELREGNVVAITSPFDQPRPHERVSSGAPDGRFTSP